MVLNNRKTVFQKRREARAFRQAQQNLRSTSQIPQTSTTPSRQEQIVSQIRYYEALVGRKDQSPKTFQQRLSTLNRLRGDLGYPPVKYNRRTGEFERWTGTAVGTQRGKSEQLEVFYKGRGKSEVSAQSRLLELEKRELQKIENAQAGQDKGKIAVILKNRGYSSKQINRVLTGKGTIPAVSMREAQKIEQAVKAGGVLVFNKNSIEVLPKVTGGNFDEKAYTKAMRQIETPEQKKIREFLQRPENKGLTYRRNLTAERAQRAEDIFRAIPTLKGDNYTQQLVRKLLALPTSISIGLADNAITGLYQTTTAVRQISNKETRDTAFKVYKKNIGNFAPNAIKAFDPRTPDGVINLGLLIFNVASAGKAIYGRFKKPNVTLVQSSANIPKIGTKATPNTMWINEKTGFVRVSTSTGLVKNVGRITALKGKGARLVANALKTSKKLKLSDQRLKSTVNRAVKQIDKSLLKKDSISTITKTQAKKLGFATKKDYVKFVELSNQAKQLYASGKIIKAKLIENRILRLQRKTSVNLAKLKQSQQLKRLATIARNKEAKAFQAYFKKYKTKEPKELIIKRRLDNKAKKLGFKNNREYKLYKILEQQARSSKIARIRLELLLKKIGKRKLIASRKLARTKLKELSEAVASVKSINVLKKKPKRLGKAKKVRRTQVIKEVSTEKLPTYKRIASKASKRKRKAIIARENQKLIEYENNLKAERLRLRQEQMIEKRLKKSGASRSAIRKQKRKEIIAQQNLKKAQDDYIKTYKRITGETPKRSIEKLPTYKRIASKASKRKRKAIIARENQKLIEYENNLKAERLRLRQEQMIEKRLKKSGASRSAIRKQKRKEIIAQQNLKKAQDDYIKTYKRITGETPKRSIEKLPTYKRIASKASKRKRKAIIAREFQKRLERKNITELGKELSQNRQEILAIQKASKKKSISSKRARQLKRREIIAKEKLKIIEENIFRKQQKRISKKNIITLSKKVVPKERRIRPLSMARKRKLQRQEIIVKQKKRLSEINKKLKARKKRSKKEIKKELMKPITFQNNKGKVVIDPNQGQISYYVYTDVVVNSGGKALVKRQLRLVQQKKISNSIIKVIKQPKRLKKIVTKTKQILKKNIPKSKPIRIKVPASNLKALGKSKLSVLLTRFRGSLSNRNKVNVDQIIRLGASQIVYLVPIELQKNDIIQIPFNVQKISTKTFQAVGFTQSQAQNAVKTKSINTLKFKPFLSNPTRKSPPKLLIPSLKYNTKLPRGYKVAYNVRVRIKGKARTIALKAPLYKAFSWIANKVDNTTTRSFDLVVAGITRQKDTLKRTQVKKFRRRIGKDKRVLYFVEKSKYAIDTIGEKKGLKLSKELKNPTPKTRRAGGSRKKRGSKK